MAGKINLEKLLPIYAIEHDCMLSIQGDITIGYEVTLPEIFTLSDSDYEAFHQSILKAVRLLPQHSILHKQDWFIAEQYKAAFGKNAKTFLSRSSERFFNERPYLEHRCYVFLTKKQEARKLASSAFTGLFRKAMIPPDTLNPSFLNSFLDKCGQFERVLNDSGLAKLKRLTDDDLSGTNKQAGILERYCFLLGSDEEAVIRDIHLADEIRIGSEHCQLFTLGDTEDLPALCGSRVNYDKYSTDRTKFSTAFSSPLGLLLDCNHIFNQYIFIGDASRTMKRLEAKRLRLQSLSAYSRENAIARDATQDFLNEAISQARLPVKAHFNILAWTDDTDKLKEVRNRVSSAMAQLDANPKQETDGAPQIWWAGLPGNSADFPMNDTFDTFLEQACCFLNVETNYRCLIGSSEIST